VLGLLGAAEGCSKAPWLAVLAAALLSAAICIGYVVRETRCGAQLFCMLLNPLAQSGSARVRILVRSLQLALLTAALAVAAVLEVSGPFLCAALFLALSRRSGAVCPALFAVFRSRVGQSSGRAGNTAAETLPSFVALQRALTTTVNIERISALLWLVAAVVPEGDAARLLFRGAAGCGGLALLATAVWLPWTVRLNAVHTRSLLARSSSKHMAGATAMDRAAAVHDLADQLAGCRRLVDIFAASTAVVGALLVAACGTLQHYLLPASWAAATGLGVSLVVVLCRLPSAAAEAARRQSSSLVVPASSSSPT